MSLSITIQSGRLQADMRRVMAQFRGPGRALVLKAGGHAVAAMATRSFRDPSLRPTPWPELSPKTLKKKAKGRTTILIDTGTLFRSVRVNAPDGDSVEIVSDRFYATFHQFGTKKMPSRPFIPATGGEGGGPANLTAGAEARVRAAMEAQAKAILRGS